MFKTSPAAARSAGGLALLVAATTAFATELPPAGAPWPGTIRLEVDATDLAHRLYSARETIPVQPGPLRLHLPAWMPGTHSPSNDSAPLAGLHFKAGGQELAWRRTSDDAQTFEVQVPRGAGVLTIELQSLTPVTRDGGRVQMTPEMLSLQWEDLLLYPAGYDARAIAVQAAVKLPEGWEAATALRTESGAVAAGSRPQYAPVPLEKLVDSPIVAGKYLRRIEMDAPGTPYPVVLDLVADTPDLLQPAEAQLQAHKALVQQSDKLYGARHFAHYDLLLSISENLGGIGLEHHESSENGVDTEYWKKWEQGIASRELLPHEYTHSWNGKYRRPADLWTKNFNVPMGDSLLWVYEGQTQYWGKVLAVRSGLMSPELAREGLAQTAAWAAYRAGRGWRNLQDTTNEPVAAGRRGNKPWGNWQRGTDYYDESSLVWLDADMLIREKTGGAKSMDDFARAFFGGASGERGPSTYTFDDVVAALNGVLPCDWAVFLRERLDTHDKAPLDGLARAGWKLGFADAPGENWKAYEAKRKVADFTYSIGLVLDRDGKLTQVMWGGPAFQAGLAPGAVLVAVNGRAYKDERLKDAIAANNDGKAPIELLVRDGENFRSVKIDWRGGLRYPKLERIEGTTDRLEALWKPL